MVKKVPLLGDIPLLGKYLFSHTEKVKSQVETIIFVTVGIVDPEKPQMALAVPEGASLVHKHVDAEGRLIKWASPAEMDPEKAELVPDVVEE
jgi:type II secretory pathway component GspD/PulD (secretin)